MKHETNHVFKTAIIPTLSVKGGIAAVEFYKKAFGAVELMMVSDPDGAIVAELEINGARFFVADESPEYGNFSPPALGGISIRLALIVADPDVVAKKRRFGGCY